MGPAAKGMAKLELEGDCCLQVQDADRGNPKSMACVGDMMRRYLL